MTEEKIKSNDRFVRLQSVLREHLTFLNNLGLIFSVSIIAFVLTFLEKEKFIPSSCQKIFLTSGLIGTLISLVFGSVTAYSRLHDFRNTVRKISSQLKNNFDEIDYLKDKIGLYEKLTWRMFYFQFGTLTVSFLLLTIAFLMVYSEKLF